MEDIDKFLLENLIEDCFRTIQNDPVLWKQWNSAKDQRDRDLMMLKQAFLIGIQYGEDVAFGQLEGFTLAK